MKKLVLAMATVGALVSAAPAFAVGPAAVAPEPSSFVQLAAGLFVLGGLALVARNRFSKSDVK